MTGRLLRAGSGAGTAAALAAVVAFTLREVLAPGFDRLPGTDAGNLYAWEMLTRSALAAGDLPYWNPFQFGGTPHLADTQTTVLYPPAMALRWLPPMAFLPWMAALHIWLGGAGMLFLARVVGLGWQAAAAAALAVALGGSNGPWLSNGHLLLIYCAAWLPWALGFAILSVRRNTFWPHPLLVAVLVLQFLSGYLQGSVYITATVCAYFLYSAIWPDADGSLARMRPMVQLGVAAILAAGVAAFQLLPTALLVSQADRAAGIPYEMAVRGAWSVGDLATFLFPFRGIESDMPHRSMSDRTAYVGWFLVFLAGVAAADRPRRRLVVFFALIAAVAVALALGDALPFYRVHFALLPGFRVPGRALFIATVAIAVLGAIGLERVQRAVTRRAGGPAGAVLGAVAILGVGVDLQAFWDGAVQTNPPADVDAARQVLGSPDRGRTLSLCENRIGPHELLLSGHATFDGVGGVFLRSYSAWTGVASAEGGLPIRRDLLDASNVTRVVACGELDIPGLALADQAGGLRTYRNVTAWPRAIWSCTAEERSGAEVIDALRYGRYDEHRYLELGYLVNVRWSPEIDDGRRLGLESRYRLREPEHREGSTWRYRVHDLTRDEIASLLREPGVEDTHGLDRQAGVLLERAVAPAGEPGVVVGDVPCSTRGDVSIQAVDRADGLVSVRVDAPAPGIVFFVEPYFPERRAFVDGAPVPALRANVAFTAVRVPAGFHLVELRIVPTTLYAGAGISGATLAAWVGLSFFAGRRRRGAEPPPAPGAAAGTFPTP